MILNTINCIPVINILMTRSLSQSAVVNHKNAINNITPLSLRILYTSFDASSRLRQTTYSLKALNGIFGLKCIFYLLFVYGSMTTKRFKLIEIPMHFISQACSRHFSALEIRSTNEPFALLNHCTSPLSSLSLMKRLSSP